MIFYVDKFQGVENYFYVIESSWINSNVDNEKEKESYGFQNYKLFTNLTWRYRFPSEQTLIISISLYQNRKDKGPTLICIS